MKRTILILSLVATAFRSNSQTKDSLYLCHDVMSNEYKAISPYSIISIDKAKKKAVRLEAMLTYQDDEMKYAGICIKSVGIGSCVEKDKLIILFADSTKYTATSWSSFDCEGYSFFDAEGIDGELVNKKILTIRFVNGRSYDSYTFDVSNADSNYFQRVFQAINDKKYREVNCK